MSRTNILKTSEIIEFLRSYYGSCKFVGDQTKNITSTSSLSRATRGKLVFCRKGNERDLTGVKDCVVIMTENDPSSFDSSNVYITVDNPRLVFALLTRKFFASDEERMLPTRLTGIHPTVIIDCDRSKIAEDVEIGPYTTIEGDCSIGKNTRIGSHVHIEGKVVIGKNVCILPLVVIGAAPGSYVRNELGELIYVPQFGGILIGDNVGIASKVTIHKAALDDTTIGRGSVIGANCLIGHNIVIGEHTFLAAHVVLGGTTKIGDYCDIGLGAVTVPNIRIHDNVIVGAGSVVTKDIESGYMVYGVPAKVVKENPKKYVNEGGNENGK